VLEIFLSSCIVWQQFWVSALGHAPQGISVAPELDDEKFDRDIFRKVSDLFISNYDDYKDEGWVINFKLEPAETLSEEYKPEDVWIGHSYFLMEDEDGRDVKSERLLYEIIPLLEEYIRDGILKDVPEVTETIEELRKIAFE